MYTVQRPVIDHPKYQALVVASGGGRLLEVVANGVRLYLLNKICYLLHASMNNTALENGVITSPNFHV